MTKFSGDKISESNTNYIIFISSYGIFKIFETYRILNLNLLYIYLSSYIYEFKRLYSPRYTVSFPNACSYLIQWLALSLLSSTRDKCARRATFAFHLVIITIRRIVNARWCLTFITKKMNWFIIVLEFDGCVFVI